MKLFSKNTLSLANNIHNARRISMTHLNKLIESKLMFTQKFGEVKLLEPLENNDFLVDEYCLKIASDETKQYKCLLNEFADSIVLPEMPQNFTFASGWTRYENGTSAPISFPTDNVMVFDVETLVMHQQRPVLAIAVSSTAWYSWCSHALFSNRFDSSAPLKLNDLIPIEDMEISSNNRIIIGHNVSFDRSFIKEQYYIKKSQIRFMDTMSMHIACSGYSPKQQQLIRRNLTAEVDHNSGDSFERTKKPDFMWMHNGSFNNLKDVHQFYSPSSKPISKDSRNIFVKGDPRDVIENFQSLMAYCANDVKATYEVFRILQKKYSERFPSPITLEGLLEMSTTYLPINQSWSIFKQNCLKSSNKKSSKNREKIDITMSELKSQLTQWSIKEIRNQKEIWLPDLSHSGAILPMASYFSTINRTCVDKLWSIKKGSPSIGSELRTMIQPPEGYSLVKFDLGLLENTISKYFERTDIGSNITSTPILNSKITRCLETKMCGDKFKDEKLNWLMQSTCVDARDLMISNMNFLIKKHLVRARISYCFVSELVYLVEEEDKARAELIMNISYIYTAGFLAHRLKENLDKTVNNKIFN